MSERPPIGHAALCLDFSTAALQCGILDASGEWKFFAARSGETLQVLFALVDEAVGSVAGGWQGITAVIYSRGPGNLLGLRIGGMALAAWTAFPEVHALPLYSYDSLQAFAGQLSLTHPAQRNFVVRCQVRRGVEARVAVTNGVPGSGEVCDSTTMQDLADSERSFNLPLRQEAVAQESAVARYCVRDWLSGAGGTVDFLRREEAVVLETFSNNSYALWSGERHR